MDKESYFLNLLAQSGITQNLNDDCALLSPLLSKDKRYIIAADSFVENIHFKMSHKDSNFLHPKPCHYSNEIDSKVLSKYTKNPTLPLESKESIESNLTNTIDSKNKWLSYENLAKKAFLVNISDILSSGALPQYALLSIVLHKDMKNTQIKEVIQGITSVCKEYNIKLIGGDTMCGRELSFHITIIGHLIGKYLHRDRVKNGDLLAYTSIRKGNLGSSFKTLKKLLRYGTNKHILPRHVIETTHRDSRFALPFLRMAFLKKSHRLLHACMDISDGLANEIKRLESQNKLTLLPYSTLKKEVYQSGEEYELLFSFKEKNLTALQRIADSTRTQIHIVGKFGRYKPHFFHTIQWHT